MSRRVISVFFIFCFTMGFIMLRLLTIITGDYAKAGTLNSTLTIDAASSRGYIYDCKLTPMVNSEKYTLAIASPTEKAVAALKKAVDSETFSYAYSRLSKGYPVSVEASRPIDCEDVVNITAMRRYSAVQPFSHLIGYLDGSGKAVCGIEKSFDELLGSGNRTCTVTYSVSANGRVLMGEGFSLRNNDYSCPSGVSLTIDAAMQQYVQSSLKAGGIECGAAVVVDIETGAIKAMASVPCYDPQNVAESLNSDNSPFLNRALNAYSVGSVYKMIVASAALESGVSEDLTYDCTGSITESKVVFNCHKRDGHGVLDMCGGIKNSCNTYFANLIQQFDVVNLLDLSYLMGLGTQTVLADGISSDSGTLPTEDELDSAAAKANISFGQGRLLATPLQIACATASIASGGIYRAPYVVNGLVNEKKELYNAVLPSAGNRVLSGKTARKMQSFLVTAVEESKIKPPVGLTAGGKTATAQSGVYSDGEEVLNTWFSGYFPADNPRYAVTIIRENGDSGLNDCQPVFYEIAKRISVYENF